MPQQAFAAKSAQALYQDADAYYKKLKGDRNIYKYRSNWEKAINGYLTVYKTYPSHNLAPSALYRSGVLYFELYNFSKKAADKNNGITNLKKVITQYPSSGAAKQAEDVLRKNNVANIPKAGPKTLTPAQVKPPNVKNIKIAAAGSPAVAVKTAAQTKPQAAGNDQLREPLADFDAPPVSVAGTAEFDASVEAAAVAFVAEKASEEAKAHYLAGEKSYSALLKDRNLRMSRQNWNECLRNFDLAYSADPTGPWAAASLYAKAMVYKDLYHYFGYDDYLQQGRAALQLIVRDYPHSAYCEKARKLDAENGFEAFTGPSLITGVPNPDSTVMAKTAVTAKPANVSGASAQKQPSATKTAAVASTTTGDKTTLGPGQEVTVKPTVQSGGKVAVTEVRHWSNPQYTRVVIGLSGPTVYKYNLLLEDKKNKLPPRLYIDVESSHLDQSVNRSLAINDDLLLAARAGQYSADNVRVVLDLKSFGSYKIFPLNDPFRIVVDIWGDKNGAAQAQAPAATQTQPGKTVAGTKTPASTKGDGGKVTVITPPRDGSIGTTDLAKQLGLGVKRIVIDPGHGGKDGGAPGALKGVLEKNVVLQISLKLREKIQKELGCEVILTRNKDVYLSLEERMAIANSKNADLFISIHTNAARNKEAFGIETYFLNLATDEESIRVAAMENATSTRGISDLQNILNDLMQNSKINESSRLATLVQKSMVTNLKKTYGAQIRDKGVKQAPFYVLLGATMPSILVETGFLSNAAECKRLTDSKYQDQVCNAIVAGVKAYIKELQPNR